MSGGGAGAALPPPGAAGAGAGLGAGAAGSAGAMAGGWEMPQITGGAQSLYAGPRATGAMAPPSSSWLQDHPKAQQALLQFGAQLMQQQHRQPPAAGLPSGSHPGHWQPPPAAMSAGLPPQLNLAPSAADLQPLAMPGAGYRSPFWGGR